MPKTIYLEFKHRPGNLAANGSDIVTFLDGRWKWDTAEQHIRERVEYLRQLRGSKYTEQLFVGFTYAGGREGAIRSMTDHNPPAWFATIDRGDETFRHEIARNKHVLNAIAIREGRL